jgi:hypothetical protein
MFVLHDRAVDFLVRLTSIQTVMGFEIFDSDERERRKMPTHTGSQNGKGVIQLEARTSVCIYIDMVFLRLAL